MFISYGGQVVDSNWLHPESSQKPSAFLTTAGGGGASRGGGGGCAFVLTAPLINGGLHQASILAEE